MHPIKGFFVGHSQHRLACDCARYRDIPVRGSQRSLPGRRPWQPRDEQLWQLSDKGLKGRDIVLVDSVSEVRSDNVLLAFFPS